MYFYKRLVWIYMEINWHYVSNRYSCMPFSFELLINHNFTKMVNKQKLVHALFSLSLNSSLITTSPGWAASEWRHHPPNRQHGPGGDEQRSGGQRPSPIRAPCPVGGGKRCTTPCPSLPSPTTPRCAGKALRGPTTWTRPGPGPGAYGAWTPACVPAPSGTWGTIIGLQ